MGRNVGDGGEKTYKSQKVIQNSLKLTILRVFPAIFLQFLW